MQTTILAATLTCLAIFGFYAGRTRALSLVSGRASKLHSLPSYYGYYLAMWCGIPSFLIVLGWAFFEPVIGERIILSTLSSESISNAGEMLGVLVNDVRNLASGNIVSRQVTPEMQAAADYYTSVNRTGFAGLIVVALAVAIGGILLGHRRISARLKAWHHVEGFVKGFLIISSTAAILTTIGIILSLLFESIRFFQLVSPIEFLFGLEWSPQTALRADQVASSGSFGAVPLFAGTMLISFIAMCVAVPVGLLSAIYMSEYAPKKIRAIAKPLLEILAGVPTVVYGFFAALTLAPWIRDTGGMMGLSVSSESALAAGLVMGIMIIPFVSSLSDDVINAVPQAMRDGAFALGATTSECVRQVILPAALPGIVGGVLLAVSRAIGETMIVVMAAGLAANLTANPLDAVTTVTTQIVTLLVGDQEFDSAKTLAAFALGLVLFFMTLVLNIIAQRVVKKYREQYE